MKEKDIKEEINHHEKDEAEIDRLEANLKNRETETAEPESSTSKPKQKFAWILTAVIIALIAIIGFAWMTTKKSATGVSVETSEKKEEEGGHSENEEGRKVKLDAESLTSAGIETEAVTQRPAIAKLYVTGAVEHQSRKNRDGNAARRRQNRAGFLRCRRLRFAGRDARRRFQPAARADARQNARSQNAL